MTNLQQTTNRSGAAYLAYSLLVVLLSVPFYMLNALAPELLPKLPPSALAVVCPAAAAVVLTYRSTGAQGVRSFLRDALALRNTSAWSWWLATLSPATSWAAYAIPSALDSSLSYTRMSAVELLALAALFLLGGVAEELGWTAYALPRLGAHTSSLRVGLEIGAVWAAWHVLPLLAVGRSATWIAWWVAGTLVQRIFLVLLARAARGGGTPAVALAHALHNLVWMLIPWYGSAYDPRADALALGALSALALAASARAARARP